jgi:hypothetical protein
VTPQAEAFDESSLDATGEAKCAQGVTKSLGCPQTDAVLYESEPAAPTRTGCAVEAGVAFDQLSVKQAGCNLPAATATLVGSFHPPAEMSRQHG